MDALIGLIIALIVFVLLTVLISRSYKKIMIVGLAAACIMVLASIGLFG